MAVRRRLRVRPIFAWFDLWVGVFIDRPKKRVYVFPLPCIGFVIDRSGPMYVRDARGVKRKVTFVD